jgi:hypothetical protein
MVPNIVALFSSMKRLESSDLGSSYIYLKAKPSGSLFVVLKTILVSECSFFMMGSEEVFKAGIRRNWQAQTALPSITRAMAMEIRQV